MDPSVLFDPAIYANVLKPPAEAETLPACCYTSEEFLTAERKSVFRNAWCCVGRAGRLARPGTFAAIDVAGVPVALLRDKAGELRAFVNACRHRGMLLLEGEGRCSAVRCPYHNWVYALDGNLSFAPEMERTAGFAPEHYGLVPVRFAERAGFVFVNPDGAAPAIDDWLGDFESLHAPWRLGDMVSFHRAEFEVACNWKPFVEVFNEYYHLKAVHPRSIGDFFQMPDPPDAVTGEYVTQFGTTEETSALLSDARDKSLPPIAGLGDRHLRGTRFTLVYPNLTFGLSRDMMWMYEVFPVSPTRTRVGMTLCFPKSSMDIPDFAERAAAYRRRHETAIAEDIAVLERQQRGFVAELPQGGRYSDLEPNVAAFGRWVVERVLANRTT